VATNGSGVTLAAQEDFPTNRGGLCNKGWTAADLLAHPDRLTAPLVRDSRGEPFHHTDWEDALTRVVAAFERAQRTHGRDAVGCFGGGGLTNEKAGDTSTRTVNPSKPPTKAPCGPKARAVRITRLLRSVLTRIEVPYGVDGPRRGCEPRPGRRMFFVRTCHGVVTTRALQPGCIGTL
jgi:Molybdopterin oxidoreductase